MTRIRNAIPGQRRGQVVASAPGAELRTTIDTFPVLAWTAGPDGAADYFNRHWLAYTGLSREASLSDGWSRALHPDDRAPVLDHWQRSLASGAPIEMEVRLLRFDGEYRWFLVRANPLRDEFSGRILKWYGANTEIEERRQLEQALRERAEDYAQLLDRVPGMLFTTTPQGEVEFVNQPLLRYFGRTLEDLQNWKQAEHVHPEDLPHTIELWSAAIESGGHCTIEQRLRRHDGTYRWFQFDARAQHDAQGRVVRWYGTLTNIDNLKRQATEIREMQARLSRASQMAGVSQLSAAIAHEVKQPLAAVLSNSDACQRWLAAEPPNLKRALQSLRRVNRDVMAAEDVIERVRLLFRRAPVAREPLNLNAVTKEVLQMMGEELRSNGVTLIMELDPALPEVRGDRVQMQQVVSNLVRNAIEAMSGLAPGQKRLLIGSRSERDQVVVRVTDNGPGVKDPDIIFEPFYTTKHSGMGMGLAISRSIVEAHSGKLWFDSPLGCGVTFALELAGSAAGE